MTHPDTGTGDAVAEATARLQAAFDDHVPCAPVRDLIDTGDIDSAYAVQTALIATRTRGGAQVVGRKIGLTNPKVQAQLGVDQPDFGVLLDDMRCDPDTPVDVSRLLQPRIEAEVAFVLGRDLDQPGELTPDVVRAAVAHAAPALEIVDSRVAGWDISIVDTIADNGSSGLFVLGPDARSLDEVTPVEVAMTMTMTRTGEGEGEGETEVVSQGSGADCLGDPLAALAWLATTARDRGDPLRAGDVVLSGALGPMVAVSPGDTFYADITGLGTVRAAFTTAPQETP